MNKCGACGLEFSFPADLEEHVANGCATSSDMDHDRDLSAEAAALEAEASAHISAVRERLIMAAVTGLAGQWTQSMPGLDGVQNDNSDLIADAAVRIADATLERMYRIEQEQVGEAVDA